MNHKDALLSGAVATLLLSQGVAAHAAEAANDRPNIIFYLTEDLSPHFLAHFNDGVGCHMPHLEALAAKGMTYTNAYSNAPVSSAARTTLVTGCYAPRLLGTYHRHIIPSGMPEGLKMFPAYLREVGYLTINAKKTDYNVVVDEDAWDDIDGVIDDWRKRPDKSQPFFMQTSYMTTHESRAQFTQETYRTHKTTQDPDEVVIQPHLPDSKLMRYTYATLYDRMVESDNEFAALLEMLEQDGEADNTIIFFFGDNGGTSPGTKGYTDNIGVQVPLVVYVPERWQEKMGAEPGTTRTDLVSFIDFAATALNMAGVEIPEQMDGEPFLGENAIRGHESVVCYGDRFDELYSFNRSIRRGNMRYERNYCPYQCQSLFALYRYNQLAFQEWKQIYETGDLNKAQSRFFEEQGVEELYDLSRDPHELNNLATDPAYRKQLESLREEMNDYMVEKCDLSFIPETVINEMAMDDPAAYGEKNRARIEHLIEVADLQRLPYKKARKGIAKALASEDEVERWWAVTNCAAFGDEAKEFRPEVEKQLTSESSFMRSRAMLYLSIIGSAPTVAEIKSALAASQNDAETLLMLNDLAIMLESGWLDPFPISLEETPGEFFGIEWRVSYLQGLYDGTPISKICVQKDFK